MAITGSTRTASRTFASTALLLASAGGLMGVAVHEHEPWFFGGLAALLALAAAGIGRRSIVAQVLSRGVAWTLFGPAALGSVLSLVLDGRTELAAMALAAASGLALVLGRPMLHTPSARAQFAPVRFRRWLLAGAVASVTVAVATGMVGVAFSAMGELSAGAPLLLLSGALAASGVGVARMRSWGVLLGMVTSAVLCSVAMAFQRADTTFLALAGLPGLMLTLPVLLRGAARPPPPGLADIVAASAPAPRLRIAEDEADGLAAAAQHTARLEPVELLLGDPAVEPEHGVCARRL
jgi:hypothetical protein